jgi:hypothetical protein
MTSYRVRCAPPSDSTGCPCGCMTKLPYVDDLACVRHQPLTFDWALYDCASRAPVLAAGR